MKPTTLYLYTLLALLGGAFAFFSDSDSDGDGIAVNLNGGLDGFETEKKMRDFNNSLDNAVDVVNALYKEAAKNVDSIKAEIDAAPKPAHLTEAKWAEIKENRKAKVEERLYKKVSFSVFKGYGNFITAKGSEDNDTMFNIGGKNVFEHPDYTLEDLELDEKSEV